MKNIGNACPKLLAAKGVLSMYRGVFIGIKANSISLTYLPFIAIRIASVIQIIKWGVPYKNVVL